jgi:hypothetical protein
MGDSKMALILDRVSVAEGREPSGFAAFTGRSPDGSRRSANKESAIWLAPFGSKHSFYHGTEYKCHIIFFVHCGTN